MHVFLVFVIYINNIISVVGLLVLCILGFFTMLIHSVIVTNTSNTVGSFSNGRFIMLIILFLRLNAD